MIKMLHISLLVFLFGRLMLSSCTKEPESSIPESSEPETSSQTAVYNVSISYDAPADTYKEIGGYTFENEYAVPVYFSTDTGLTDFAILSLSDAEIDDDGNLSYGTITPVYSVNTMASMQYVTADLVFYGTIPNNGFSYTDADGTVKVFTISQSGDDGSLEMNILE